MDVLIDTIINILMIILAICAILILLKKSITKIETKVPDSDEYVFQICYDEVDPNRVFPNVKLHDNNIYEDQEVAQAICNEQKWPMPELYLRKLKLVRKKV